MAWTEAEREFRCGLCFLEKQNYASAEARLLRAIELEGSAGVVRPQMRYMSYYALARALARRPTPEDVKLCEKAAAEDDFDPDLQLNLGKLYLLTGKTAKALKAFQTGLRLDPTHPRLNIIVSQADRRSKPPLPALDRDHPINRTLGRLRASLFASHRPRHAEGREIVRRGA
jgi:tetratricopeptide (TPR) repeat protein